MLLPVGADNFGKVITNKNLVYIDKSLFIKEVFDDMATEVAVITRPRRFGKTLALSMLHYFLAAEISGHSTVSLFDNLKIAQCGQELFIIPGLSPIVLMKKVSYRPIGLIRVRIN